MRPRLAWLAAVLLALGTTSCTGDGPDFTWLRAVHTIPDGPPVRVVYDEYVFRTTITFGESSNEVPDSVLGRFGGTGRATAEYFVPGNVIGGTLFSVDVPVEKDQTTTLVLAGTFEAPEAFTVLSPRRERPLATLHFQFAHAVPAVGALDVYVTAPDVELTSTAPLATVEPLDYTPSLEVPFGDLRLRLTRAGTLDVVLDSGTRAFAEQTGPRGPGNEWLFTVSPSLDSGPSPVNMIANSGRSSVTVRDVATPATVRVYHAAPGIESVDFLATTETETQLIAAGLEYQQRSPLLPAPTGELDLAFQLAEPPSDVLASAEASPFLAAQEYGVFLAGSGEETRILKTEFQPRSVATESRFRIANLAPDSQFFSLYLTRSEDEALAAGNRVARDVRFGEISPQFVRSPGEYFLVITQRFYETLEQAATTPDEVVIGPVPLELLGGDVLLFALYAPEAEGEPEVLVTFDAREP